MGFRVPRTDFTDQIPPTAAEVAQRALILRSYVSHAFSSKISELLERVDSPQRNAVNDSLEKHRRNLIEKLRKEGLWLRVSGAEKRVFNTVATRLNQRQL